MDLFSVITLFGGLAFFLYGMHVMSASLEKVAGGKFEQILKQATSNKLMSFILGMVITIAIQSSSATTVMLVGLVNSGIMEFGHTIGVIMGSNVGTTLTAWILSLSGLTSDNVFIRLLRPESFAPIFAFVGIVMIMASKAEKKKNIGMILVGFSIIMFGMELMSDSVSALPDNPAFTKLLTAFSNPILGVLIGTVFTGLIQSSAAAVGILQALSLTGTISYSMAIPVIMGLNIGTCVTALMSSIGVSTQAKRVSVVHIFIKLIGTLICLSIFSVVKLFLPNTLFNSTIDPLGVAIVHTIFNLVNTFMLLPFTKQLEKLTCFCVRGSEEDEEKGLFLDDRLLNSPSVAIAECRHLTCDMAKLAEDTFEAAMGLCMEYSEEVADKVIRQEEKLDRYEDKLGTYLIKLSGRDLTDANNKEVSVMQHCVGNIERIGDHAVNLVYIARDIRDKNIVFSDKAKEETNVIIAALTEILNITMESLARDDLELAKRVEPLEQVIDKIIELARAKHMERLQDGECTIKDGFVFNDILSDYERVSDHCSNIAVCLIRAESLDFETHEYLSDMKKGDEAYTVAYEAYRQKYAFPE